MIQLKLLHPCKAGEICKQDLCVVYAVDENEIRYCVKQNDSLASAVVCEYKENILNDFEVSEVKVDNPCEIE